MVFMIIPPTLTGAGAVPIQSARAPQESRAEDGRATFGETAVQFYNPRDGARGTTATGFPLEQVMVATPFAADTSALSLEAERFCREQHLTPYLLLAEGLVKKHFPAHSGLRWEHDWEHEVPEQWFNLHFEAPGPLDEVMKSYSALLDDWSEGAPWPQCDLIYFAFLPGG